MDKKDVSVGSGGAQYLVRHVAMHGLEHFDSQLRHFYVHAADGERDAHTQTSAQHVQRDRQMALCARIVGALSPSARARFLACRNLPSASNSFQHVLTSIV